MNYPVKRNGVYQNPTTHHLEYWFVFKGRKAKVGECRHEMSEEMKMAWEARCTNEIQKLLVDTFGARPINLQRNG